MGNPHSFSAPKSNAEPYLTVMAFDQDNRLVFRAEKVARFEITEKADPEPWKPDDPLWYTTPKEWEFSGQILRGKDGTGFTYARFDD